MRTWESLIEIYTRTTNSERISSDHMVKTYSQQMLQLIPIIIAHPQLGEMQPVLLDGVLCLEIPGTDRYVGIGYDSETRFTIDCGTWGKLAVTNPRVVDLSEAVSVIAEYVNGGCER
jgi:hypothetical protein